MSHCGPKAISDNSPFANPLRELVAYSSQGISTVNEYQRCPISPVTNCSACVESLQSTMIIWTPERHTNTLVDCVHAHVFVEFGRCIPLSWFASSTRLAFQPIYVLHTLSKFGGPKVCERETNDDHCTCKFIRKVQAFWQFCTNHSEKKSPRFFGLVEKSFGSLGIGVVNTDCGVHTSSWQAAE